MIGSAFGAAALLVGLAIPALASAQIYTPSPQEGIFVPLAPCRIYKSVTANNNVPLPSGSSATVSVSGTGDFTGQGGPDGGCGVPPSATAVAVSVTTSHATSTGTLAASIPGSSSASPGIAITFSPSLSQTTGLAIGLSGGTFKVEPIGGSTNVTVDVTGYWAPQIAARIFNGSRISVTSRIVSATHPGVGYYEVTVDRDVTDCQGTITPYEGGPGVTTSIRLNENVAYVYLYTFSNGAFAAADGTFGLVITC